MSVLHAADVLFKTAVVFSWIYAAYHSWRYNQLLSEAMLRGTIPSALISPNQRMGLAWMIASPGVVPGGDAHRRKCMYGAAAFVALLVGWVLYSVAIHQFR
jgi:hypothetical protein